MKKTWPSLNQTQQQFYKRMLGQAQALPFLNFEDRMAVYSDGYVARLSESLSETYKQVKKIITADRFFNLSRSYMQNHPSTEYNLNSYGKSFPEFLAIQPSLRTYPWIADLARLEWLILTSFHAFDKDSAAKEQLAKVAPEDFGNISFRFQNSFLLFYSDWPLKNIWDAFQTKASKKEFEKQETYLVLYRLDDQVYFKDITKSEFNLLDHLRTGRTIGQCLEETETEDLQVFSTYFQFWMSIQIIQSIEVRK